MNFIDTRQPSERELLAYQLGQSGGVGYGIEEGKRRTIENVNYHLRQFGSELQFKAMPYGLDVVKADKPAKRGGAK